jgi:Arc/MetJ-type ribon-helix-helix transcriptional regulator
MELALKPGVIQRIADRVKSGKYGSAEDVVAAAIMTLDQQERMGDFASGELTRLLEEGERSIAQEGTLDGGEAFRNRKARRQS